MIANLRVSAIRVCAIRVRAIRVRAIRCRRAARRAAVAAAAVLCTAYPAAAVEPGDFTIARVQYDGGGDWYGDPSSLPNLLRFVGQHTRIAVAESEANVRITDEDFFAYPYAYLTGHGNIALSPEEVTRLRRYLEGGGFLHADDNYGMDASFRREMKRVFPKKEFVELPPGHGLFHCHFDLPGLPKIHAHDGARPQALGLFESGRLVVLYTYESDLGDGWEDADVHDDPEPRRRAALEAGTNIVVWALTH